MATVTSRSRASYHPEEHIYVTRVTTSEAVTSRVIYIGIYIYNTPFPLSSGTGLKRQLSHVTRL